ncbi:MAG: hypothetical protein IMZ47_03075 [Firmicutes bacterium]|nr:hypothetical protein [Bacillota bacterium]
MNEQLKKALEEGLRKFRFELFPGVQNDIARTIGEIVTSHGHTVCGVAVSSLDEGAGFKALVNFDDEKFEISFTSVGVEINGKLLEDLGSENV